MIELTHLQKVLDQTLALDIDTLAVAAGDIVAVVGPVGSGKTVLLDLLIGRTPPTVGSVSLAGVDPAADKKAFSRSVGVLFAEDSLYKHRSPRGNLDFYRRLRGLPRSRMTEVLASVGLADRAETRLDKLPSGMRRRLAFACATLHHPSVLILAKPFARCDEASIALLNRLIRERALEGAAVLILADDAAHLRPLCDVIYPLEQGRLGEAQTPQQETEPALPFKIPVKLESKVALVNPGDVLCAVAQEGRSSLQTVEGSLPTQFTLTELEERLARSGFFRAHRSYLVNLQHVKAVIPYTRNAFSLILDDADSTEIPLSKSAAAELRELLDY
jgi:ABC-2 type transport system ATP-binding protein